MWLLYILLFIIVLVIGGASDQHLARKAHRKIIEDAKKGKNND